MKAPWIAWGVSIGQFLLLGACGFVLARYWLMLPVWMRNTAAGGLGLCFLAVLFRLTTYHRKNR